jgi:hypothetical protein
VKKKVSAEIALEEIRMGQREREDAYGIRLAKPQTFLIC